MTKENTLDTYESIFQQGRLAGLREALEALPTLHKEGTTGLQGAYDVGLYQYRDQAIETLTALIEKK